MGPVNPSESPAQTAPQGIQLESLVCRGFGNAGFNPIVHLRKEMREKVRPDPAKRPNPCRASIF
jgi:hypothetical protein